MVLNKHLLAGVCLLCAASAHAQSSVTLYGKLDAGLLYQNENGGPGLGGATKKSTLAFASGGDASNVFGFAGREDLGDGLQVGFQLQGQFSIGSGSLSTSGTLFSQYANLYMQSARYGRVTIGQQIDPAYISMGKVDPRDLKQAFSAAGWWNFLQGKNTTSGNTVYESNSVGYTYKEGAVSFGALYRFGNQAGTLANGRTLSTGGVYDDGHLIGSASFLVKNASTGGRDLRIWSLGAGYRLGDFTLRGLYTDYDLPQGNAVSVIGVTPASHIIVTGAGVNWSLSYAQILTLAYYYSANRMDSTNATQSVVLADDYLLSKRTKVYGYVGLMVSKKGANGLTNLMTASLTSGYPGANSTAIGVGIQHAF